MKTCIGAPAVALFFTPMVMAGPPPAFSDTFIGYRYSSHFSDPGKHQDVAKHIVQLAHVSRYALGQQFANLDVFRSDRNDPRKDSSQGATEVYLTYRNQLQPGQMFDRPLAFGPVKDVALTVGFDWNTKNNAFQSRKRMLVIGPTLKFALPAGFLDLSLYYAREWNHCGLDSCEQPGNHSRRAFDPFYQVNLTWGIPFALASVPMKFQGFYSYSGQKGDDYRHTPTADEQLMRASLMLDAGQLLGAQKNRVWVGPGYEYWRNKFGNRRGDGTDVDAVSVNLEWHF